MFKQAFEWIHIVVDVGMHDIVRETLDQTTQVPSPSICVCVCTLVVHNTMWNIKSSESSPLKVTYAPTYMCIYWYVCMYHTYTPGLLVTMYYHTGPCVADPPGTS